MLKRGFIGFVDGYRDACGGLMRVWDERIGVN